MAAFNQPPPNQDDASEVLIAKCWTAQQAYPMPDAYDIVPKEELPCLFY